MYKFIHNKISIIICIFALTLCLTVVPLEGNVLAANNTLPNLQIIINEKQIPFSANEQGPVIIEGRTFVPLRVIAENLGAKVDWLPDTRQVIINRTSNQAAVSIPASPTKDVQIIMDGQLLIIPVDLGKAYISKLNRTMIPLRAVSEAMGYEVNWTNGLVKIQMKAPPVTVPDSTSPAANDSNTTAPVQIPAQPVNQADSTANPTVNTADNQLFKDLAQYKTNLKLKDGSVINSEVLTTKDPSAYSAEQLAIFKTYLAELSKYQPMLTMPGGEQMNTADITIVGDSILTADQLRKWINNETPRLMAKASSQGLAFKPIPDLAELYIRIGAEYGIRGDLAFCQAAKETGYWQFTGSVKPEQNNYCGLYATGSALTGQESLNGADPGQVSIISGTHGAIFSTPEAGVEAHIQHLYAYAGKNALPSGKTLVDPRFSLVSRGIAPTWQKLNARWAVPGITYGQSLIYDYWFKAANTK